MEINSKVAVKTYQVIEMNDGTDKINMNSAQNHLPDGEEKLLKSLNSHEGIGSSFVECLPNSSELIINESSGSVNNLINPNEAEVLLNMNQRDETVVQGDVYFITAELSIRFKRECKIAGDTQEVVVINDEKLPSTAVVLKTSWGSNVYVIGTAHFSEQSQEDVAKVIRAVQPNSVVLELCRSRSYMLQWDEEVMLKMSEKLDYKAIKQTVNTYGVFQGIVQLLLLSVSSQITRKMEMAPGGEFRRAFKESLNIPGCLVYLGDRPIEITLRRAFASMSWWQLIKFAYCVTVSKTEFNEEEIEKCKNRDSLENMLEMFGCEFPELKEVFVNERDLYLTYSLLNASRMTSETFAHNTVVGVVGMGHLAGIQMNWESGEVDENEIQRISKIPPQTRTSKVLKFTFKASFCCLALYGLYKIASKLRFSTPS